jgi:predicted SAM-dependent methyltransferase
MTGIPNTMLRSALGWLLPKRLLDQVAFEARAKLKLARTRTARVERFQQMDGIRIQVGCGPRPFEGWVNLDLQEDPRIEYWDARQGLPFRDGAAEAIYAEHFLEHLEYSDEAPGFLGECHRCLKSGGVLRVIVPDAEAYLRLYAQDDWDGLARLRPLTKADGTHRDHWLPNSYATRMELINAVFRQDGEHRYAYDFETLERLLQKVGFKDIRRVGFGVSTDPSMPGDTPQRASESLYVEAIKT